MIIGHEYIRERMNRAIRTGNAARAFLFLGPEHVGKFTVARDLAMQFLGLSMDAHSNRPVPDLIVLSPERVEEKGKIREKQVSVESVREAIHLLALSSFGGKGRVLLIENVGKLSEEAQNALLKTVEEPPENTLIILIAHEFGAALPTLASRSEKIFFSSISPEEMHAALPNANETLMLLGLPGLAATKDQESIAEDLMVLQKLDRFDAIPIFERLSLAESLANDIPRAERILLLWMMLLRQRAAASAESICAVQLTLRAGAIHRTLRDMRRSVGSARILLESFFASGESASPVWSHVILNRSL